MSRLVFIEFGYTEKNSFIKRYEEVPGKTIRQKNSCHFQDSHVLIGH